jgi:glycosyltransferase involved in cell wall biosynthesis
MNKVLIITYYWPPSGGAGVQRWLKFAKYLPEYGWEPVILTVDPEYAAYPATDNSLEREIPASLKVFKTKATDWFRIYSPNKSKVPSAGFSKGTGTSFKSKLSRFIRGNFFIPDPRRGWNRFAFRKACEIIESEKIVTFVTTSPPHSTQLIGLKLKKKFPGLKWIADLRDPWTDIYYYDQFYPTIFSKSLDLRYEKSVLKKADRIIAVGQLLLELLAKKTPQILNRSSVITNGYDESDFLNCRTEAPGIFTITYVGTLSEKYPAYGLIEALQKLRDKNIKYRVRFTGTIPENIRQKIVSAVPGDSLELIPYSPHDKAVSHMADSSVLVLIIPEAGDNRLIITGKLFEYAAARRPILCIGPSDGEAAKIISDLGAGECFDYSDIAGIENFLEKCREGQFHINPDPSRYSRKKLTEKLASVL